MSGTTVFTIFGITVSVLLFIDLFVAHPAGKAVSIRSSATWSVVWIAAGLGFGVGIMSMYGGSEAVSQYLTAYVVEKTLSVDNIFLWLLVFSGLAVPAAFQRRVLVFGVLGAVVLRTGLILAGTAIVERFAFVMIIAGAFLVYAGIKLWRARNEEESEQVEGEPKLMRLLRKVIPTTDGWRGDRFFVREDGKLRATPLFLVLVLIELSDVVFALDALPAGISITTDVNIILTANLFAVLGLRSLYFLLVGFAARVHYLKAAVGVILVYIGANLLIEQFLEEFSPSTVVSLGIIVLVLVAAVWASLRREKRIAASRTTTKVEPTSKRQGGEEAEGEEA